MARKNTMRNDNSTITFDTKNKSVMADVVQDNVKEKVTAVREVVQGRSNNEIILVLQYYDYDVEKAIQAYLEDGAKAALTEWRYSGTKPVKKKRNKKKSTTDQKEADSAAAVASNNNNSNKVLVNGDVKSPIVNGVLDNHIDSVIVKPAGKPVTNGPTSVSHVTIATTSVIAPSNSEAAPVIAREVKVTAANDAKEKSPSPQPRQHQQGHHGKQRTHSGSHHDARHRTTSTSSVGDGKSGKKPHTPAHHGLERSAKDLHRQTVSLERLRLVFNEEVDKTYKRIKSVFDELKYSLMLREAQLNTEMNNVRDAGRDVFTMRQGLAAELKMKIDRAEKMSETELAELRSEIKHFVSERKMDEDLGRNTRFFYDNDRLTREILQFGEVAPVKCTYSQRRASISSAVSDDHPLPGQVTSSSNHNEGTNVTKDQSIAPSTDRKESSPAQPHLDPSGAHEIAELQKRLKHSLTLGGIPVETYQERPDSAPVPIIITETAAQNKTDNVRRNNRNRRQGNRDRGDRGPREDNRMSTYNQNSSGERVILIGKNARPQSGPARPPRGGRGRGGYRGRGRGGNGNQGQREGEPGSSDPNMSGATTGRSSPDKSPDQQPLPRREGSGSPRKGRGGNRGGQGGRGRGSPQQQRSAAPDTGVTNS